MAKYLMENEKLTKDNIGRCYEYYRFHAKMTPYGTDDEKHKMAEELEGDKIVYKRLDELITKNATLEAKDKVFDIILTKYQKDLVMESMHNRLKRRLSKADFVKNDKEILNKVENSKSFEELYSYIQGLDGYKAENFADFEHKSKFISNEIFADVHDKAMKEYMNSLSDEQIENIGKEINELNPIYYQDFSYTKKYENDIKKLKEKNITSDSLDKVNDLLLEPNYTGNELNSLREFREHEILLNAEEIAKEGLANNTEYNLNAIKVENNLKGTSYHFTVIAGNTPEEKEKNKAEFEKMKEADFVFSEEAKNGVKEIFNKLEEYGYYENHVIDEQGTKAYAFTKYNEVLTKFRDELRAINNGEKEPNQEVLDNLSKEILMHDAHAKELLELVHKNLPTGNYDIYPGNVDAARTETFPPYIREDLAGMSQLSAMFAIYSFYKGVVAKSAEKPTIDEFLNHPLNYLRAYYRDNVVAGNDLNKTIQGKDGKGLAGVQAIRHIIHDTFRDGNATPLANQRIADSLAFLDKENLNRNIAVKAIFEKTVDQPAQQAEFNLKRIAEYEYGQLDKFLIVDEPQKDLKLLNFDLFNPNTLEFENKADFDEIAYILDKGQKPEEFAEKIKKSVIALIQESNFGSRVGKIIEIAQRAALKYMLVANPDRNTDDLERLKAFARLDTLITDGKGYLEAIDIEYKKETGNDLGVIYPRLEVSDAYRDFYVDREKRLNDPSLIGNKKFEYDDIMRAFDANQMGNNSKGAYEDYVFDTLNLSTEELNEFEIEGIIAKNADINTKRAYLYMRDEYCRNKYGEEYDELSPEDKDIIYARYIEQAKQEKEAYAVRNFLVKNGLSEKHEIHSTLEETLKEMEEDKEARALEEQENAKNLLQERINTELSKMDALGHKDISKNEIAKNINTLFADASAKIDESKTNYQQELQNEKILDANDKLAFVTGYAIGLLPDDVKNDLYNKLDDATREKIETQIKAELANIAKARITIPKFKDDAYKLLNDKETSLEEALFRVDSLLTSEEKNSGKFTPYNRLDADAIKNNRDLIVGTITSNLTDRQLQLIDHQINQFKPTFEVETNKTYVSTHEPQINILKDFIREGAAKNIYNELEADEELRKLDYINNLVIDGTGDYGKKIQDWAKQRQNAREKDLADITEKYAKDNKLQIRRVKNRFDISLVEQKRYEEITNGSNNPTVYTVENKNQKEFQKLRNREIVLSKNVKENIKYIFDLMEKYGYTDDGIVGEKGEKVYGLKNYVAKLDSIKAFLDKAQTEKGLDELEKVDALTGVDELLAEKAHVDNLLSIIHYKFPVNGDNAMFPDNLDVARNAILPTEWRRDIAGVSTLNGLYTIVNFVKVNDIKIDDFLNHPIKYINKYYEEKVYAKLDPNQTLKGKTGIDALMHMLTDPYRLVPEEVFHGIGRMVETLAKLDPNVKNLGQNLSTSFIVSALGGNLGDAERRYFLPTMINNLDRFFYVKEPLENASILTYPTYDPKHCRMIRNDYFDEVKYIQNDKRTLAEFKTDLDKNIVKALQKTFEGSINNDFDIESFNPENVLVSALNAATKYLIVHGQEVDTKAYNELKDFTDDSRTYLKNLVDKAIETKDFDIKFADGKPFKFVNIDNYISEDAYDIAKGFEKDFKDFAVKNQKKLGKLNEPALSRDDYLKSRVKDLMKKGSSKEGAEVQTYSMSDETKDRWYGEYLEQYKLDVAEKNKNIFQKYFEEKGLLVSKPVLSEEEIDKEETFKELLEEENRKNKDLEEEKRKNRDLEEILDDEEDLFSAKEEKVEVKQQIKEEAKKEVKEPVKEEIKSENYKEPEVKTQKVDVDAMKSVEKISIDFEEAAKDATVIDVEELENVKEKEDKKIDDVKKGNELVH